MCNSIKYVCNKLILTNRLSMASFTYNVQGLKIIIVARVNWIDKFFCKSKHYCSFIFSSEYERF